jgi:hypothetical protein
MMVDPQLIDEFSGIPIHHPYAVLYFSLIEQRDCWIPCTELKQIARLIHNFKAKGIPCRVFNVRTREYFTQQNILALLEKYQRYTYQSKVPEKVCFFQIDNTGEIEA